MKEVLIEKVVEDWNRITDNSSGHCVLAGQNRYEQPHVYFVAHLVQMRAAGFQDADFDDLIAVSGASALFGYEGEDFMPKYAHLAVEPDRRIAEATGFGYRWVDFDDAEDAFTQIKRSIDAGVPLKGWDWENCLFAGYRDAENAEDRAVFTMASGPEDFAEWRTWEQFCEWAERMRMWRRQSLGGYHRRVSTIPARSIAGRVISDLVSWSAEPPESVRERHKDALFGIAAIEAYARDCADTTRFEDWVSCHPINSQWTTRNSSAIYLERAADLFRGAARTHVLKAAEQYRECFALWREFYRLLGHRAPEGAGRDPERRAEGAAVVLKWLDAEGRATDELRAAIPDLTAATEVEPAR